MKGYDVVSVSSRKSVTKKSSDHLTEKKLRMIYFGVGLIVFLFVFIIAMNGLRTRPQQPFVHSSTPTPTLTSTPTPRPIPTGKRTFSVSSGKKTGPLLGNGVIDPYDPKLDNPQIISISIASNKPVTTAKLTIETDTKSKEVLMKLASGTITDGIWEGTWTVDDTYLYTYNATITATDGQETNSVKITLR